MNVWLQYILSVWNWIVAFLLKLKDQIFGGPQINLDSGIKVKLGREIAQGGYSVVYEGFNVQNPHLQYAVKRINCHNDSEMISACMEEANVHRTLQAAQEEQENTSSEAMYCLPLLGMTFEENNTICYMVFPYLPHSLRWEVNQRVFNPPPSTVQPLHQPWSEGLVLNIFAHLCQGVSIMHKSGLTHRDIKLENILFQGSNTMHLQSPVLMDFGSVGPLLRKLETRKDILEIADEAAQHTTMPYRPPELFPGELRAGDEDLDYTKVDVWGLGCSLFAMLYGASPFECEFTRNNSHRHNSHHHHRQGRNMTMNKAPVQIVECSQLRVLGNIPKPPPAIAKWYSPDILELIEFILVKDRLQRPTLEQVQIRTQALINGITNQVVDLEDPMDSLLSKKRHNQEDW